MSHTSLTALLVARCQRWFARLSDYYQAAPGPLYYAGPCCPEVLQLMSVIYD